MPKPVESLSGPYDPPPALALRAAEPPPARLFSWPFARLLIAQAGFGYAFAAFFVVPKYAATELGAGPAAIGALNAVHGAAAVVSLFAAGVLVDRYGRRPFLICGALAMTACSLGFLAVERFDALIFALRVGHAVAFALAYVAGAALTVDHAPPARLGQAIGFYGTTMLSMNAVAPLAVETLANAHGYPIAFASSALGALLCTGMSLTLPAPRAERGRTPGASPRLLALARRPEQLRVAGVIALVGSSYGALFVFGQLQALAVGRADVHTLLASYALAAVTARVGLGHLGDRHGRLRVAASMLVVYAAAAAMMIELGRLGLVPVGLAFGFAHGLFFPTYNASVVERAVPAERGRVVALFQAWFNAGLAAGSFAFGWVAEHAGLALVFVAAALGLLAALVLLLREGRRRGTTRA